MTNHLTFPLHEADKSVEITKNGSLNNNCMDCYEIWGSFSCLPQDEF